MSKQWRESRGMSRLTTHADTHLTTHADTTHADSTPSHTRMSMRVRESVRAGERERCVYLAKHLAGMRLLLRRVMMVPDKETVIDKTNDKGARTCTATHTHTCMHSRQGHACMHTCIHNRGSAECGQGPAP